MKAAVALLLGPFALALASVGANVEREPGPAPRLDAWQVLGPGGGGTMLLPGSHRLVDHYRSTFETPPAGGKANWHPFLRRHPPLGAF